MTSSKVVFFTRFSRKRAVLKSFCVSVLPGARTCVGALRSCVFHRAMLAGIAQGFGGKPPIFLTFAHAKTLFGNSVDLLVEFLSIIS